MHLTKSILPSSLPPSLLPSLSLSLSLSQHGLGEYRGPYLSKSLLRGNVSRRTVCPETSTFNYGLEQMNVCCVKTLRFCGSMFLCYPVLTNITFLFGLLNDARLLE